MGWVSRDGFSKADALGTRHRASTSTRWHLAFGAMLYAIATKLRNSYTDYKSAQ